MNAALWSWSSFGGVVLVGLMARERAALAEHPPEESPWQETTPQDCSELPRAQPMQDVDLALCLDTSGSMQNLIEAAKQKLWSLVNELARAEPRPRLRVALLTYGNDGHPAEEGWVRVDCELTADLDLVSQRLFALTTDGGTELVGRVVSRAVHQLGWSDGASALRLVVVAGNESADQDPEVKALAACSEAIARGILVHTIYCGDAADDIAPGWQALALAADGRFAALDQRAVEVVVSTPYDAELASLGASVNRTYVPFGREGQVGWRNQAQQDSNAVGLNAQVAAERSICKNSSAYVCGWDLVDACETGQVKLAELANEALPEVMRGMSREEQRGYLASQAQSRRRIRSQVEELAGRREAWIAEQRGQGTLQGADSLDVLLLEGLRESAQRVGMRLRGAPPPAPAPESPVEKPEGGLPQGPAGGR